ncbi:MAG: Omp28-related outer membrane protein [Chitinophagaceae bacterium]|nr:Omp28-related outer membrane protein [Chitinophagaceae bacterium]MCB9047523.1 Omp28-related outer membrane protein [Chitinophagales bacterium]
MKKLLLGALMLTSVSTFAQTKKVIMEDFTGLKCGWCPEGTVILEGLYASQPAVCIPVAVHGGGFEPSTSPLKTPDGDLLVSDVNATSFPCGAIDRVKFSGEAKVPVGRGSWVSYFNQQAATTAIVSIGFANKKYNATTKEYTADVNVEFSSLPTGKVRLQVYAIEDSIPATGVLAQDNYSSNVQSGASPLNPWFHNRTFRAMLAGSGAINGLKPNDPNWTGTQINGGNTIVVNTKYTYQLKFTMNAAWNKDHVHLVAYVTNDNPLARSILNAEEAHDVSKTFWPESVSDVNNSVEVANIYPSPAAANGVLNVQYNIKETSDVSMKVYNSVGQLVAQPYNSHEVAGSHIITFSPAAHGLSAGLYMIEVATATGKQIQKVTLF